MYKIMALAMTAAMVVPMAAQTTVFAADDKEITYWNIAVEYKETLCCIRQRSGNFAAH